MGRIGPGRCLGVAAAMVASVGAVAWAAPPTLRAQPGKAERWLQMEQMSGRVRYRSVIQTEREARLGDRLRRVGDAVRTEAQSTALLQFDDGIGRLRMQESTSVTVGAIDHLANGGKATRLSVQGGQVQLTLRSFNNPHSLLEVVTPAGTAGVRGTAFGVSVSPDGRTAVGTRTGLVAVDAQGEEVRLPAGFQALIAPGEAPRGPFAIPERPRLYDVRFERPTADRVRVLGRTDPGNTVRFGSELVPLDLDGNFSLALPLPADRLVPLRVSTVLDNARTFNLTILRERP